MVFALLSGAEHGPYPSRAMIYASVLEFFWLFVVIAQRASALSATASSGTVAVHDTWGLGDAVWNDRAYTWSGLGGFTAAGGFNHTVKTSVTFRTAAYTLNTEGLPSRVVVLQHTQGYTPRRPLTKDTGWNTSCAALYPLLTEPAGLAQYVQDGVDVALSDCSFRDFTGSITIPGPPSGLGLKTVLFVKPIAHLNPTPTPTLAPTPTRSPTAIPTNATAAPTAFPSPSPTAVPTHPPVIQGPTDDESARLGVLGLFVFAIGVCFGLVFGVWICMCYEADVVIHNMEECDSPGVVGSVKTVLRTPGQALPAGHPHRGSAVQGIKYVYDEHHLPPRGSAVNAYSFNYGSSREGSPVAKPSDLQ